MNMLEKVKTAKQVEELIHESLLKQIPQKLLKEITENILLFEQYFRGEVFVTPEDLTVTRFYSRTLNKITQIDFAGVSYKV